MQWQTKTCLYPSQPQAYINSKLLLISGQKLPNKSGHVDFLGRNLLHALTINGCLIQNIDRHTKAPIQIIHRSRRGLLIMGLELSIIGISLLFFVLSGAGADTIVGVYNVKDYAAVGDGHTDNTKVGNFSCLV